LNNAHTRVLTQAVCLPLELRVVKSRDMSLVSVAFLFPNKVSASKLQVYFEGDMKEHNADIQAVACRWVVQAQHFFWPAAEWLRINLLRGFMF
jgi:hypothetical protein